MSRLIESPSWGISLPLTRSSREGLVESRRGEPQGFGVTVAG
jgi:hypothetical protein